MITPSSRRTEATPQNRCWSTRSRSQPNTRTLHILNVADTGQDSVTSSREAVIDVLEEEGQRIVEDKAQPASDRDVSVVPEVLQGDPYNTIIGYIVLRTHGRRGLQRFLLGTQIGSPSSGREPRA